MKVMIYSSHLIPGVSTMHVQSVYSTLNRRAKTQRPSMHPLAKGTATGMDGA